MSERWRRIRVWRGEHGQTLILVAASMLVLLLFAALAVDVGFWYGQRRHMQNAADAGALAGAWEICNGNSDEATTKALDYAEYNGADRNITEVGVDTSTGTVVVTATTDWQPFLARSVVSDMTAGAVAAARCGPASQGCGMWPVAFDETTYITGTLADKCSGPDVWPSSDELTEEQEAALYFDGMPENSGEGRVAGTQFILWAGDNEDYKDWDLDLIGRHCRFVSHPIGKDEYKLAGVMGGTPMDPGNRGWVALRPDKGYVIPEDSAWNECSSADNCGSAVNCWLEFGYIGSIGIGDCLASLDGGVVSALKDYAVKREGDAVSVILYEHPGEGEPCVITENSTDTCGGNKTYHVSGIGCIRVEHVFDGKNCNTRPCPNITLDDKNSIHWDELDLGGTDPWDVEYTLACSRVGFRPYADAGDPDLVDLEGRDSYGYDCRIENGTWVCGSKYPSKKDRECPTEPTGIVVTKLCACPPTDCIGTGASDPNSAINAVSLIPVPED